MTDLSARHALAADDTEARVLAVVRSGRWIGGPVVAEAEQAAAALFGRAAAVGVASGTDALMLSLQALGIGPGSKVVVPALSFFATAGAVRAVGADVLIVDVDERGLLDPAALAACGSHAAVVPVHLFGNACHTRSDQPCLDDAAQSAGSPTPAGELTAASTYPTKSWSGLGDGGFVLSDDPERLAHVRKLGNHGQVGPHLHSSVNNTVGRNSRLDPVSAAMLLGQQSTFADRTQRRRTIAAAYDEVLSGSERPLRRDSQSATPTYCLRSSRREHLQLHLADHQIESAVYYPRPLHHQPALASSRHVHAPMSERLSNELLALPVHAGLTDSDVNRVLEALATA